MNKFLIFFLYSEPVFETCSGEPYSVRLNMETLAPDRLEVDANVIDCLAAILNHENRSRVAGCPSRHFFPTGCIVSNYFFIFLVNYFK